MFVRDVCGIIEIEKFECAKFRGSRAIVGLVGLVPWCLRGYFVGSKLFLVGISWVQNIFSWVYFVVPNFFRYFVGPRFFLGGISWVQDFSSWVFRGFKIFSRG